MLCNVPLRFHVQAQGSPGTAAPARHQAESQKGVGDLRCSTSSLLMKVIAANGCARLELSRIMTDEKIDQESRSDCADCLLVMDACMTLPAVRQFQNQTPRNSIAQGNGIICLLHRHLAESLTSETSVRLGWLFSCSQDAWIYAHCAS